MKVNTNPEYAAMITDMVNNQLGTRETEGTVLFKWVQSFESEATGLTYCVGTVGQFTTREEAVAFMESEPDFLRNSGDSTFTLVAEITEPARRAFVGV